MQIFHSILLFFIIASIIIYFDLIEPKYNKFKKYIKDKKNKKKEHIRFLKLIEETKYI